MGGDDGGRGFSVCVCAGFCGASCAGGSNTAGAAGGSCTDKKEGAEGNGEDGRDNCDIKDEPKFVSAADGKLASMGLHEAGGLRGRLERSWTEAKTGCDVMLMYGPG